MVDVLGKLVAEGGADVRIRFFDKVVGGYEPADVGHGLQIPDYDVLVHPKEV
jgi:hypothetical protein